MSLGAVIGIAGGIMSSRAQKKAQAQQNAYNTAAGEANKQAEIDRDYLNQYGVYSRQQRPFEEAQLTPWQRMMRLGGFTPETRQVSQDLMELQRQYDAIDPTSEGAEVAQQALQGQINAKLQEKSDLEYTALAGVSTKFDTMRQAAQAAAAGVFDGSMLQQRLASLGIGQGLRGQLATTRQGYLPGIEAAQDVLVDPARGEELRALNLQRAQAMDDPAVRALRLQQARDRSVVDPLQQSRRDLAETSVAGIKQAALAQSRAAGMGRTYGGSSSVLNRTLASLAMAGNQQAAVQRAAAERQNLMEDQGLLQRDYGAQAANLAEMIRNQRFVNDARVQNQQQFVAASSLADRNKLEQIQNRQSLDEQSLSEQMQSASETDAAKLASQRMQLANVGLPDQLFSSAAASLTAVERQQQALDKGREQAMGVAIVGQGRMAPTTLPVQQAFVNDTLGAMGQQVGRFMVADQAGKTDHQRRMEMLEAQQRGKADLQRISMGQGIYGGGGGGGGYGGFPAMNSGGGNPWGNIGMFGGGGNPWGSPDYGVQSLGGQGNSGGGFPGFEYKTTF